jgi:hypothetical protein
MGATCTCQRILTERLKAVRRCASSSFQVNSVVLISLLVENALQYVLTQNGAGNIWEQLLSGTPPRQLTRFTPGQIFDFNWSSSERRFLVTRGEVSSNVVLLSGFR